MRPSKQSRLIIAARTDLAHSSHALDEYTWKRRQQVADESQQQRVAWSNVEMSSKCWQSKESDVGREREQLAHRSCTPGRRSGETGGCGDCSREAREEQDKRVIGRENVRTCAHRE